MLDHQDAGPGHNNPPPYDEAVIAPLADRVRELDEVAKAWDDIGPLTTEDQASALNDFLAQTRAAYKQVEEARKAAKQPHLDAGTAVDAKFKTLAGPLESIGKRLKDKVAVYLAEKQRKLDEQKRREREEAARKEAEAARLQKEAEQTGDAIAKAEAEEAAKAAAKATKAAEKPASANIASATGGGRTMAMRTTYRAEIADDSSARKAFSFLLADPESHPALIAELERLASAARRRKDGPTEIPGIIFHAERSAA